MVKASDYLWLLPFLAFFIGYIILSFIVNSPTLTVPNLLGKTTNQALLITSNNNLYLKIIDEKEDLELPQGTILHQTPINQTIKRNQTIYVLISKKPEKKLMPNLLGKNKADVCNILEKEKVKAKKYYLTNCPSYCFGQHPSSKEDVPKEKAILYFGSNTPKPCLFPNLKGIEIGQAIDFLKLHELEPTVYRRGKEKENYCKDAIIIKQKPIAGSLVNLKTLSTVLLEID